MLPALALALLLPATDWKTVYSYPGFEVDQDGYIYDIPVHYPFEARQIRIHLTDAAGTVCGAIVDSVDVNQGSGAAAATSYGVDANGILELQGSTTVYGLRINYHQPNYSRSYCDISIESRMSGGGTPTSDETLAGVVQYRGGFLNQSAVEVASAPVVTSIRVAVPDFCTGVQVLEAGTVTEGQYDKAAATDSAGVFAVNNGAGTRISGLRVTLNGPLSAQCDVPVYIRTKAP